MTKRQMGILIGLGAVVIIALACVAVVVLALPNLQSASPASTPVPEATRRPTFTPLTSPTPGSAPTGAPEPSIVAEALPTETPMPTPTPGSTTNSFVLTANSPAPLIVTLRLLPAAGVIPIAAAETIDGVVICVVNVGDPALAGAPVPVAVVQTGALAPPPTKIVVVAPAAKAAYALSAVP